MHENKTGVRREQLRKRLSIDKRTYLLPNRSVDTTTTIHHVRARACCTCVRVKGCACGAPRVSRPFQSRHTPTFTNGAARQLIIRRGSDLGHRWAEHQE